METISDPKNVKARKDHVCNFCGFRIAKGEIYNTATYKYDDIYVWKSHLKCIELMSALNMEGDEGVTGDDFCEYIKQEFDTIRREIDEEYYESEKFEIPDFDEQVAFVYEKRCGGKKN